MIWKNWCHKPFSTILILFIICTYICIIFSLQRRKNSSCFNCLSVYKEAKRRRTWQTKGSCGSEKQNSSVAASYAVTCMFSETALRKCFCCFVFCFFGQWMYWWGSAEGVFGFVYFVHTCALWSHRVIRLCLRLGVGVKSQSQNEEEMLVEEIGSLYRTRSDVFFCPSTAASTPARRITHTLVWK